MQHVIAIYADCALLGSALPMPSPQVISLTCTQASHCELTSHPHYVLDLFFPSLCILVFAPLLSHFVCPLVLAVVISLLAYSSNHNQTPVLSTSSFLTLRPLFGFAHSFIHFFHSLLSFLFLHSSSWTSLSSSFAIPDTQFLFFFFLLSPSFFYPDLSAPYSSVLNFHPCDCCPFPSSSFLPPSSISLRLQPPLH